jgi:photosystem II stability/assembly factor-like uncharacterized protein
LDGGINWIQQYVNTTLDLNSVSFVDMYTGWSVGQNGIILNTRDGGINWNTQNSPIGKTLRGDNDLYSVYFTDINIGWAVGRDGIILNTINGGVNWVQVHSETSNNLYSLFFPNESIGWIVGSFGTLLKHNCTPSITDEASISSRIPKIFRLEQNYPNPFNPTTTIRYDLPKTANVLLKIYNMLGQEIHTLVNERQAAGKKSVVWDGRDHNGEELSSGTYISWLRAGNEVQSRKIVVLR